MQHRVVALVLCASLCGCVSASERRARAYAKDFVQSDARSDAANTADARCNGNSISIDDRQGYSPDDYQCAGEPLLQVATSVQSSPIPDEIPFEDPGREACSNPSEEDARPFMLCLAETRLEEAEAEMKVQLKETLASVEAARGRDAARRVGVEQLKWIKRRDRDCETQAAASPSTQVARHMLSCQTQWTKRRTANLKSLAASE